MTLSLDDVRNKRFRMARKSGYEVLEVDEFVDEVEVAFAQLVEENETLKQEVGSLQQAPAAPTVAAPTAAEAPAAATPIVVTTGKEASSAVVRLVELSTEQAERLVAEASAEAKRIREEAQESAHQLTTDARTKAERLESDARANAERAESAATARAEQADRELAERRTALFSELEQQREQLARTVNGLRDFETTYRSNLAAHLRRQIEVLGNRAEPTPAPDVPGLRPGRTTGDPNGDAADGEGEVPAGEGTSSTPRLDALLGEQS